MYVVDSRGVRVADGISFIARESQHLYWHRSAFSGGRQAERLVEAGIGYWPADENVFRREWPSWCGCYDLEDEDAEDVHDDSCAIRAHLRYTGDERPGIAVYKICHSNDGWWVTDQECASALKLWEELGKPDVDDGRGDTIPFLMQAAAHGGFRVW